MELGRSKYLFIPLLLMLMAACSTRPTYFVKLDIPGGGPGDCQNVPIEFLAYNYPGVLDSLRQINEPGPRPDSTELMVLLGEYQEILERSSRMADSVDSMREKLENLDNRSVDYRKMYPIFQKIEKQMEQMLEQRQEIHKKYLDLKSTYDFHLGEWTQTAYKGFADFKEEIPPELQTKVETTDSDCMVKNLTLPFGQWWLHAEVRKPGTNNVKLIWDLKLPAEGDSVAVVLDGGNARELQELL